MDFHVVNGELCVDNIEVLGVSASSLFLIGDAQTIQLSSAFDTPPESLIIGPTFPFIPKG